MTFISNIIEGIVKIGSLFIVDFLLNFLPSSPFKSALKLILFAFTIISYIMSILNPKKYKCDLNNGGCILSQDGKYNSLQDCKNKCYTCAYSKSDHNTQLHYVNDCSSRTSDCNNYYSNFKDSTDKIFKYRCNMDTTCNIDKTKNILKKKYIPDCSTNPVGDKDTCHKYYSKSSDDNKNYRCHIHDGINCTIDKKTKALIADSCPTY